MKNTQLRDRMTTELKVVRHLIRTAKKHGYAPHSVDNGEERIKVATESQAMEHVFSVDESTIFFKHPDESKAHCAVIVLGNCGWDTIADNSQGGMWDAVMGECDAFSDKLCEVAA